MYARTIYSEAISSHLFLDSNILNRHRNRFLPSTRLHRIDKYQEQHSWSQIRNERKGKKRRGRKKSSGKEKRWVVEREGGEEKEKKHSSIDIEFNGSKYSNNAAVQSNRLSVNDWTSIDQSKPSSVLLTGLTYSSDPNSIFAGKEDIAWPVAYPLVRLQFQAILMRSRQSAIIVVTFKCYEFSYEF